MIVEKKTLHLSNPFTTEKGAVIKKPVVAYEEYGFDKEGVVFVTHGGLQDNHLAGKYAETDFLPGAWDAIIGSGKAIDTDRFRVISANSLGSMFGTSSPLTKNPDTDKLYAADFPSITMEDMVRFQKAFLDELEVKELKLMTGPSMGGLQCLHMAALYPDFVKKIVPVAASGRMTPEGMGFHFCLMDLIQKDPLFNNGNYDSQTNTRLLYLVHQFGRIYFGNEQNIKQYVFKDVPDNAEAHTIRLHKAYRFLVDFLDYYLIGRDLNCYLRLLNAVNSYDLGNKMPNYAEGVSRIKCPVLMINFNQDSEFPPYWATEVADILNQKTPNQVQTKTSDSIWGHYACVFEVQYIAESIKAFFN